MKGIILRDFVLDLTLQWYHHLSFCALYRRSIRYNRDLFDDGSAQNGVNMDPIIELLDRFKAEQERLGTGHMGGVDVARVRELESRVVELTNRNDISWMH